MAEIGGIGDMLDSLTNDLVAKDSLAVVIALNWDQEWRKPQILKKNRA